MRDIRSILVAGHTAMREAHGKDEAGKNTYRVGSSGNIGTDGKIRGVCPRVALLRKMKIEETPTLSTQIMWSAGEASEWNWSRILDAAGVKYDTQRDINWTIENGDNPITVTGHPDLIMEDSWGIELKGVFSYNTAASVFIDKRPKNENVIQSLSYQIATGLPWQLVYTSPSFWKVPFYDKKKTDLKSIPPFYVVFDLEWRDDVAWYKHEEGEWTKTVITKKGIEDYYRMLAEMEATKTLGPRPTGHYIDGTDEKFGGDACFFCPMKAACDDWDSSKSWDRWIEMCKDATE